MKVETEQGAAGEAERISVRKVRRNRMFQHVVRQLERAMLRGDILPGEPLPPENRLKEMFDTSRGTVREALRILEEKGLVEVRVGVGGGAFVKEPGPAKMVESLELLLRFRQIGLDHLAEFRRGIEGQAAELAALRITPEGVARLGTLLDDAASTLRSDPERFMEMDVAVHVAIAEIAENPLFVAVSRMVHERILGASGEFGLKGRETLDENLRDLSDLVRAVTRGQAERAGTLARAHVEKFHKVLKTRNHSNGEMEQFIFTACQGEKNMKAEQYIEMENRYGAHNYKPLDVVLTKGRGVWVWDVDGNRYMDCLSAYSAVNQGHCHPRILRALTEQAEKLTLTSRAFRNDQLGPLYEELCSLTNSHKVLPMNSGAEAVETAVKAVRKWGYQVRGVPENQAEVIVCENNFHGRTISIISFSTDPTSTTGFGPFTPGFKTIPFGDAEALERAITPNTVGFLVEPIQGEAGVVIPPDGYLKQVREICNRTGITLIFDEIQTGLGRTGKLLAEEHEGVEADLTLIGKALSGGFYPVSAVLSNTEVLGVLKPGEHGSTFGGNPLACAVAREALKVLVEENLIQNAADMGAYFLEGLRGIDNPLIREVRGRGLLIGVEFAAEAGGARQYCEKLKTAGLLCKETHDNIIRFAPPLVATREDIDWALERIVPILGRQRTATTA